MPKGPVPVLRLFGRGGRRPHPTAREEADDEVQQLVVSGDRVEQSVERLHEAPFAFGT
jgi:hypothetical protein